MSERTHRCLYWAPRILSIAFILFISLFALDVFNEGYSPWNTLLALLIHLIPTFLLAAALALAWRWEWIGAVLFLGFGAWYVANGLRGSIPWAWYVLVAGPPALVGMLFALNWRYRRELHEQTQA